MNVARASSAKSWFDVLLTASKTQVAMMKLAPGKSSGPRASEHPRSDQALYVIQGELLAEVGDEKATLRQGDVVIVPAGMAHRFVNHSGSEAVTLNVYTPPAY